MNYFKEAGTVEEIKYCYRKLCMKFHPDRGGSTETMQAINAEYQSALQAVNGQQSYNSNGQQFTYHYKEDIETAIMDIIDVLLSMKMPGVDIVLIGVWVWIMGDNRNMKNLVNMFYTSSTLFYSQVRYVPMMYGNK